MTTEFDLMANALNALDSEICERDARIAELSAALRLILTDNGLNPENRAQAREALEK